jgi:hypothetical protein
MVNCQNRFLLLAKELEDKGYEFFTQLKLLIKVNNVNMKN